MEIGILKQQDFMVWVPFLDAEVLVRHIGFEEMRNILRQATARSWDRRNRLAEAVDYGEAGRLLGRAAVRGWRGITLDGEDYPYSEENCDFLMAEWIGFAKFVSDVCIDVQALSHAEEETRRKNSGLTSGQE